MPHHCCKRHFNSLYFFVLLFLFPVLAIAQIKLTGTVTDADNKPLEFAEVVLQDSTKVVAASALSTDTGAFILTAKPGNYTLRILFMGEELYTKPIALTANLNLAPIQLQASKQLDEVVVETKKQLVVKKVDRLVFNVENSISASGGDALDALKLVPRVKVENDVVSVVGKGSIAVMVDDRLMRLTGDELTAFLKSIKSDDIKSIEVITNPPAKYSAEGNSGLINIKLKKTRPDTWNASVLGSYRQNSYATGSGNVTFNYQKNKFTLQSSAGYTNGGNKRTEDVELVYPDYNWMEKSKSKNTYKPVSGRLGIDYKFSDKVTMGSQYIGSHGSNTTNENLKVDLVDRQSAVLDSIIQTRGNAISKTDYNSLNYHTIYTIDTTGVKLSFDADYFNYVTDNDRRFATNNFYNDGSLIPNSYQAANNIGSREVDNFSANADMEHPLKWVNLNYGVRVSYTKTQNDFALYDLSDGLPVQDLSQSNQFIFKENTQAAFIDGNKEFGKWEAKAGLRMENTRTKGTSITTGQQNVIQYTRFFPTAYLVYKPNENHSVSLNYGKRIGRPSYEFLNPFRMIMSPYSYSEGNPYLKPSYSHNIELEYGYKDFYTATVYFSGSRGGFEQVTVVDPVTSVQHYIPQNFITNNTVGFNQYLAVEPFKWLKTNFSADVYFSEAKSTIPVTLQFLDGWNGVFRINNDFMLNKNKTFLFNFNYSFVTRGVDNLDTNSATTQLNSTLKLFLLNKKLQFTLYGNDVLRTSMMTYSGFSNGVKNTYANYNDQRNVRLSVLYTFGGELKNAGQRESKNSDEQNRL